MSNFSHLSFEWSSMRDIFLNCKSPMTIAAATEKTGRRGSIREKTKQNKALSRNLRCADHLKKLFVCSRERLIILRERFQLAYYYKQNTVSQAKPTPTLNQLKYWSQQPATDRKWVVSLEGFPPLAHHAVNSNKSRSSAGVYVCVVAVWMPYKGYGWNS